VDFVRKSVRAIGRCAIKVEQAAERCVSTLLDLIQTKVNYVVQEAVIVIKVHVYRLVGVCLFLHVWLSLNSEILFGLLLDSSKALLTGVAVACKLAEGTCSTQLAAVSLLNVFRSALILLGGHFHVVSVIGNSSCVQ